MTEEPGLPEIVSPDTFPANVRVAQGTVLSGNPFRRFRGTDQNALTIGPNCTMDHVQFAVGLKGRLSIGENCYFTSAVLLCEEELRIGNYVVIGWNVTISDSDFHPLDAAQRVLDAIALSPVADGQKRPVVAARPVIIEDDVWIGPAVVVLKGVTIGAGSWIEPGSVVTASVAPGSRMAGNPAKPVNKG